MQRGVRALVIAQYLRSLYHILLLYLMHSLWRPSINDSLGREAILLFMRRMLTIIWALDVVGFSVLQNIDIQLKIRVDN